MNDPGATDRCDHAAEEAVLDDPAETVVSAAGNPAGQHLQRRAAVARPGRDGPLPLLLALLLIEAGEVLAAARGEHVVQDLAGELDLELADRVSAAQATQRRDELVVGLVGEPALAGEHVERDRDDDFLFCWSVWRSCARLEQRELVVFDVDVAVGRHAGLGWRRDAAACIVRSVRPAPAVSARERRIAWKVPIPPSWAINASASITGTPSRVTMSSSLGTFSMQKLRGGVSQTIRMNSNTSSLRGSSGWRLPAFEKPWHGGPPNTQPIASLSRASSARIRSPVSARTSMSGSAAQRTPNTLAARHSLASAFLADGRVAEAIELYEPLLNQRKRILGPAHPNTLITRHDLATAYQNAGRTGGSRVLGFKASDPART